jgi:hypothetical protein
MLACKTNPHLFDADHGSLPNGETHTSTLSSITGSLRMLVEKQLLPASFLGCILPALLACGLLRLT